MSEAEDAARWRWVLAQSPATVAAIAYQVREACVTRDPVEAVDIARKAMPNPAEVQTLAHQDKAGK